MIVFILQSIAVRKMLETVASLLKLNACMHNTISNGNRTEWSPIRSVIQVITKFVDHEYDYRPNWTTQSLIAD